MMRVITGLAKGRRLRSPKGDDVRPTGEKVKEAVFSSIHFELSGAVVLDLFAGTGQLGIEALSRGASHAVFVDLGREQIEIIGQNVEVCGFGEMSEVLAMPYDAAIRRLAGRHKFDVVFIDPPYSSGYAEKALNMLAGGEILAEGALIILEGDRETGFGEFGGGYSVYKDTNYGKTRIVILRYDGRGDADGCV